MRVLSLFAGVGGFDLGFERAGMEIAAQCEFDPHAQSVLRRHWPGVPLVSDVKDLRGADHPADVIVGGFPCQDVSVAGKREGLAGERSGLFFEAVRVIEEMREATQGEFPKYVVIENVPGLFSSRKGADFRAVIETLVKAEVPMPRSGKWAYAGMVRSGERQLAWRTLDSQHFGVAQRRRRVFLVLGLGGRSAAQILFEHEGVPGHTPQGREAGEEAAADPRGGAQSLVWKRRGGFGWSERRDGVAPTLESQGGSHQGGPENLPLIPVGFNWQNGGNEGLAMRVDGVGPLDTSQTKAIAYPIQDGVRTEKRQNGIGVGEGGEPGYTLDATGHQAVAFAQNSRNELRLEGGDGQRTDALSTGGGKPGQGYKAIATRYAVRRLMPGETERLQAMPDGWTRFAADGKEIADTHRYRMVGNAVTVSVVEWLGHGVAAALSAERELEEAA